MQFKISRKIKKKLTKELLLYNNNNSSILYKKVEFCKSPISI
jgi:hypothetical protein